MSAKIFVSRESSKYASYLKWHVVGMADMVHTSTYYKTLEEAKRHAISLKCRWTYPNEPEPELILPDTSRLSSI